MAELTTPFNLNLNLTELERITIDTEAIATDTDLSNIFYFAEIPQIPQARESNLQSLISTIEDCKAWETTRCEQSVQSQIAKGNLPGDSSVAACRKRTAYRSKVLNVLRATSPWIVNIDTGVTAKFKVPATKPLNLAVVNTLINIEPLTANLPYRNFLKAVAAAFNPKVEMVQPYYHTVIGYQYDNVIEEFQAVLLTVTFEIEIGLTGGTIEFTSTPATFSVDLWDGSKPDPATTETGRVLNLQKSLTVLAPPANE